MHSIFITLIVDLANILWLAKNVLACYLDALMGTSRIDISLFVWSLESKICRIPKKLYTRQSWHLNPTHANIWTDFRQYILIARKKGTFFGHFDKTAKCSLPALRSPVVNFWCLDSHMEWEGRRNETSLKKKKNQTSDVASTSFGYYKCYQHKPSNHQCKLGEPWQRCQGFKGRKIGISKISQGVREEKEWDLSQVLHWDFIGWN